MDRPDKVGYESLIHGEVDKLFAIIPRNPAVCPEPDVTFPVLMDRPDKVGRESLIRGKIDELFAIISRNASLPSAKPEVSRFIFMDRPDRVGRESLIRGKIDELFAIIPRNPAVVCTKPEKTLPVLVNRLDIVIFQSIQISVVFPCSMFKRRKTENNILRFFRTNGDNYILKTAIRVRGVAT